MKKVLGALLALAVILTGSMIISCGETDPALAPAGATIRILGTGSTWIYGCSYGVPHICFEGMKKYMQDVCQQERTEAGDSAEKAQYDCVTRGDWVDYADIAKNQRDYAKIIIGDEDACGSLNNIVTAFVSGSTSGEGTSDATETEGASLSTSAMNDIEVRFIAINGEMYKLSDISGSVAPLANPYITRTDDRGKAEVKYLTHFPNVCGSLSTYILQADIGVSVTEVIYTFEVDDAEEVETDDSTGDDDDTA